MKNGRVLKAAGENFTSPNCDLADTYARLMMAENPDEFNGKESLGAIVRSKLYVDRKGKKDKTVMGVYKNREESVALFNNASKRRPKGDNRNT